MYGKSYKDLSEYEMRKAIFEESMKLVNDHNAKDDRTWSMGINEFSDRLPHEMSGMMGGIMDNDDHKELLE